MCASSVQVKITRQRNRRNKIMRNRLAPAEQVWHPKMGQYKCTITEGNDGLFAYRKTMMNSMYPFQIPLPTCVHIPIYPVDSGIWKGKGHRLCSRGTASWLKAAAPHAARIHFKLPATAASLSAHTPD